LISSSRLNITEHPSLDEFPVELHTHIEALLENYNGDSLYKGAFLIEALRFLEGKHPTPDLKMTTHVLREVRQGLDCFEHYKVWRKVSFFGSARTPATDPRYRQTSECAEAMREAGFMIITGGGGGQMQAANEGAGREHSFGININLPMEQEPNHVVADSPRHFSCQYFFTRKLFFLKESDAVILTPGGFGTLDETFETLTLLQTGRNPPIPVVLLEAPGDDYWGPFIRSWMRRLIDDELISASDQQLVFHTDNHETAVKHINDYYINYHSFRYVGNWILLRILNPLSDAALERLNAEFTDVLHEGEIEQVFNWPKSDDKCFSHLPRLRLQLIHNRVNVLPQLIRRVNALYARDHNNDSGHSD